MLMLISSLKTNSIDEDLICYNYTINSSIDASTYIYNWIVSGNPIAKLLMPFDTDSSTIAKDYSGDDHNGTVVGPIWINGGVVGGAYQFDGVNDHISIPYCFDSDTINKITVETWVKTTDDSGVIASFDRNNYWELGFTNGEVRWSTTASDRTTYTVGKTIINNGIWHYIAAMYDSFTGECKIYVDGKQDVTENGHAPGESLGLGGTPQGSIGTGAVVTRETIFSTSFETQNEKNNWMPDNETWGGGTLQWQTLFYDDFENEWDHWGHWNDGGDDCSIYTGATYPHQGQCAARLRDDAGWTSSATDSDHIHAASAGYTQMSIDFWWKAASMEPGEDFWIRYYDGSTPHTLKTLIIGTGTYTNGVFYHTICYLNATEHSFNNNIRFGIQCDASDDNDYIYIDQIYVNATTGIRIDYDFDLLDATALSPQTGSYSLGGFGDFDPDYALFNRTGIDVSGYKNVNLSVWYSYKSTESADKLGFYYKDGSNWATIFEILNPQIGDGNQLLPWAHAEVQIPDHVDNLVLQFNWSTSSTDEYVAIDDLEITGIPLGAGENFSGLIDEFCIYNRALSSEQIYQNYLCMKDGHSDKRVIVSGETIIGDIWKCVVTPNDGTQDDISKESNIIQIVTYPGGV
jgi:hypothetical protein